MARSPLTLAAAATAAVPGVEIVGTTALSAHGEGRNDSAVVTLADGTRAVVRLPRDEAVDVELASEALALRALTDGVRALLGFEAPRFLGVGPLDGRRVFVTSFIPGYQVDAGDIPSGRGVASSVGETLAAVHALPASFVRNSGLPHRTADQVRQDARRVLDESSATGRVPVRLMVRWRDVLDDDSMWQFEPAVTLGGTAASAFVYEDRDGVPTVSGVVDWHALQVTDPAVDLQFLMFAPDAIDSVYQAYVASSHRAPDEMVLARARLHSELDVARWLLHGRDTREANVVDDAAAMLDTLAEDVRDDDLRPRTAKADIDDALAALRTVPQPTPHSVDTSMHTDTYDPADLDFLGAKATETSALAGGFFADDPNATQALDPSYYDDERRRVDAVEITAGDADPNATQALDPSYYDDERVRVERVELSDDPGTTGLGSQPASTDDRRDAADATDPNATQGFDSPLFDGAGASSTESASQSSHSADDVRPATALTPVSDESTVTGGVSLISDDEVLTDARDENRLTDSGPLIFPPDAADRVTRDLEEAERAAQAAFRRWAQED
ncbi:MAG: aminoglycoside phosphotransferase [Microbacterium sp.]|jgi:aminoglycoside phosphotransferase (APT) family kinase protein|nr:aminoglycoside phosphotransferase [Microbacterium sp.]